MSGGRPSGTRGRWGRPAGALLVGGGLLTATAALRPAGGLLGTAASGPVGGLGFAVLLGLGWAGLVGRFAVRLREEVRHLDGPTPRAERLREAAVLLLPLAAVAVPILLVVLQVRASSGPTALPGPPAPTVIPQAEPQTPSAGPQVGPEVGVLTVVLLVLLVLAAAAALVLGAVVLFRLRRRRDRRAPAVLPGVAASVSPEDALAEAVASGRRALGGTDARAAVIACYAAMEGSLAASGLPRHASESPTELLRRALSDERIDAAAATELTALFREARFSTHPMDDGQVRRARTALDAIAARLADTEPAADSGAPAATEAAHTGGGDR
ncbi:DUF4129 domain-containing protein [Kitasatospora sp. NPDC058162]|uniref:DUF4129 domain-containing protein n=1 Tax=Kitasatospora sp. NPDC058162 TaxID=3346362 RepID=UPI0036D9B50C